MRAPAPSFRHTKIFLRGIMFGSILSGLLEAPFMLISPLRRRFWDHPFLLAGYHVHHSVLGLFILVLGCILAIRKSQNALFWIGLGIGIIVLHTLTDGRLIFVE